MEVPSLLDFSDVVVSRCSFGVVLCCYVAPNPFQRLTSGWLDRILRYSFSPPAPFTDYLESAERYQDWSYLTAQFTEFVDYLHRIEAHLHWQHGLLLLNLSNYGVVVRLALLSLRLLTTVSHGEETGAKWPGPPRMNEKPSGWRRLLFSTPTVRKVALMYEADFSSFGYSVKSGSTAGTIPPLSDGEFITAIQRRDHLKKSRLSWCITLPRVMESALA